MHRDIAIIIEILILSGVIFVLLWAVRMILFDLLLSPKYKGIITMLLTAVGAACLVFLISHLISFYPTL